MILVANSRSRHWICGSYYLPRYNEVQKILEVIRKGQTQNLQQIAIHVLEAPKQSVMLSIEAPLQQENIDALVRDGLLELKKQREQNIDGVIDVWHISLCSASVQTIAQDEHDQDEAEHKETALVFWDFEFDANRDAFYAVTWWPFGWKMLAIYINCSSEQLDALSRAVVKKCDFDLGALKYYCAMAPSAADVARSMTQFFLQKYLPAASLPLRTTARALTFMCFAGCSKRPV